MSEPMFPFFDPIVVKLAGENWRAHSLAPSTLKGQTNHWWLNKAEILVSDQYSDRTIFGSPHVNHAFRAWHDRRHVELGAAFDREGERRVYLAQVADVERLAGYIPACNARRILECEIMGQFDYQASTGQFPVDQRAFTVDYFNKRGWSLTP